MAELTQPPGETEQASVVPVCEWGCGRVRTSQPTPSAARPPSKSVLHVTRGRPAPDRWAGPSSPSPCRETLPGGPPVVVAPSLGHPRYFSSHPFSSGVPGPAARGPPPPSPLLLSSGHPVQTCRSSVPLIQVTLQTPEARMGEGGDKTEQKQQTLPLGADRRVL